jgi:hypothetical protein
VSRAHELFDQLHDELADLRLRIAIARDAQLTPAELAAMLEVYGEFGR